MEFMSHSTQIQIHVQLKGKENIAKLLPEWIFTFSSPFYHFMARLRHQGGVTSIDSIVTAATTRSKLWPSLFSILIVDHADFRALTVDCVEFQSLTTRTFTEVYRRGAYLISGTPGRWWSSNLPKVWNHGKSNLPKLRDHRKSNLPEFRDQAFQVLQLVSRQFCAMHRSYTLRLHGWGGACEMWGRRGWSCRKKCMRKKC